MLPSKRGERQRKSENKQTYLLWFLKKEEDRKSVGINRHIYLLCFLKKEEKRETLASPLQ
jgi:hypothetical protein